MNREREQRLRRLDRFVALLGLLAFLMLVLRHGFPQLSIPRPLLLAWGVLLPIGFFLESLIRLLWVQNPWRYLRLHPFRYIILLMILLELSGAAAWSAAQTPMGQAEPSGTGAILNRRSVSFTSGELYLAIVLLGFAGSWAQGVLTANRWLANRRIPVLALPALTFAAAILAGTALLALPGLHRQPISLLDSLFTATSALCVTGLSVYDIAIALNPAGQTMLALLIQVGGLGTMTILGSMALWHRGTITVGERIAFSELVGGMKLTETRKLLGTILKITLLVEGLGILAFWLLWRGRVDHALLKGAFHSISAFCNAGFALFSDSFASFHSDPPTLIVLMLLIIAGGAGFPVLANLNRAALSRVIPWQETLSINKASRVVLLWSGGLPHLDRSALPVRNHPHRGFSDRVAVALRVSRPCRNNCAHDHRRLPAVHRWGCQNHRNCPAFPADRSPRSRIIYPMADFLQTFPHCLAVDGSLPPDRPRRFRPALHYRSPLDP